jgi:hypothetical protein
MVNEFKTKIDLAREMLDVLKGYFRVSKVVFDSWYWSEKLVKDNVVSELKSNRRLLRVESARGTLEEVEGHLRVGDPQSLLRRPDPWIPSDYGKVASPGTLLRDTREVPLHDRPLAQRGGDRGGVEDEVGD